MDPSHSGDLSGPKRGPDVGLGTRNALPKPFPLFVVEKDRWSNNSYWGPAARPVAYFFKCLHVAA